MGVNKVWLLEKDLHTRICELVSPWRSDRRFCSTCIEYKCHSMEWESESSAKASCSVVCVILTDQTQLKEIEENSKNEEISEPIYMNVNGRKQTAPVKLEDLHAYILKNKENNCDGFRKEFEVMWTEFCGLVL